MALDPTGSIDLKRLRMVVEVARAQAITSAAASLGLTQSAVSRGVAEIEDALGARIFERLPRGIRVTDGGRRFVARARRLLADVDDLVTELREDRARVTGRLRIGVTVSGTHATWVLATFAGAHPDVAIETTAGTPQALCPRVAQGELDMVLGSSSYLRRWRDLDVTDLAPLHFACMLRKDHPLASVARPREIDVLNYPAVMNEIVDPTYSDLAQRYVHHGLPRFQAHYVSEDFALVRRFVSRTDAFFPLMSLDPRFWGLGKEFLLLRDTVALPPHHVSFACAKDRPRAPVVEALARMLVDRVRAPAQADARLERDSAAARARRVRSARAPRAPGR